RFPQQPGRLGRRQHAANRKGGERAAASHRPRRRARRTAGDSAKRFASGASRMSVEITSPRRTDLPAWMPAWATQLAELYYSGTTAAFILHGNTYDLFRVDDPPRYGVLAEFLAEQLFGRWSLVLHYDLARGLRAFAGRDEQRLKEMVALAN